MSPGPTINHSCCLSQHKQPIVALGSSYQSRRGEWADDLGSELVSCDDQGTVCVWQAKRNDCYECVTTIEGGVPCCSLAVRRAFIVAAQVDGQVKLYGLVSTPAGGPLSMVLLSRAEGFCWVSSEL